MIPIASKFLKDVATLNHRTGLDNWGKPTYDDDIALSKIYVEAAKQTRLTSLGESKSDKYLLIFDVRKSLVRGTEFAQLDKVVYDNEEMTVRKASLLPNRKNPHHWEVYLT